MELFDTRMGKKVPKIKGFMQELSINSTAFVYDWFFTLFTRSFDRRIVKVVWDIILLLGPNYVLETGISMFYCMQEKLMEN